MAINACNKGKQGERNWANFLKEHVDPKARRGFGQSAGGSCRPDVETTMNVHFEVKAVEALNIDKAMSQAIRDARPGAIPAVAHKKNRSPWMLTILASDLVEFCEEIIRTRIENELLLEAE